MIHVRSDNGYSYAFHRFTLNCEPFRFLLFIGIIIGLFVLYVVEEITSVLEGTDSLSFLTVYNESETTSIPSTETRKHRHVR